MLTSDLLPLPSMPQATLGTPSGSVVVPHPVWLGRAKTSSIVLLAAVAAVAGMPAATHVTGALRVANSPPLIPVMSSNARTATMRAWGMRAAVIVRRLPRRHPHGHRGRKASQSAQAHGTLAPIPG